MDDGQSGFEWLEKATRIPDIAKARSLDIWRIVAQDAAAQKGRPDPQVAVDPRTGTRVIHSEAREGRPHDHPPAPPPPAADCFVCAGRATSVIDRAPLSSGETFISVNHYPLVYPLMTPPFREIRGREPKGQGTGVHLLQWCSTDHGSDLANMAPEDIAILVERLGALEHTLYRGGEGMPEIREGQVGHVGIVKNVGRLVGGSVEHGHQQIVHTNLRPLALAHDAEFERRTREPFSGMMLRKNPEALTVADYDGRFRTLVPWFMLRPLEMMIVTLKAGVRDLRDLDEAGRLALGNALRDAAETVTALLPAMGREIAWNLTVHNGIADGLYLEILPYTQERGGYEALGISLCEGTPASSAERIREYLFQDE